MTNLVNKILDMDADQFETEVFNKITSSVQAQIKSDNSNEEE